MKCFECDNEAENEHHPIPKSLGGTKTIMLCQKCHDIAHSMTRTSTKYLTIYGLAKLEDAVYARIFWAVLFENKTLIELKNEHSDYFGDKKNQMTRIRKKFQNLLLFNFDDLFNLINPILEIKESDVFNKVVLGEEWDLLKSDSQLIKEIIYKKCLELN